MTERAVIAGRESEAGFTLIELLVALALFSLLVTVLFDAVRSGLLTWNKASGQIEQLERSMAAQDVLRRTIGNLYPMAISENGGPPLVDFDGEREAMAFLGGAPLVTGGAGRFRYKLSVEHRNETKDLVLVSRPELAAAEDRSMTAKTLLVADIERAEFSYLGEVRANQPGQWSESWAKHSEIPWLIRIRVTLRDEDAEGWPELRIAPRVLADVGCVYDPISMRCRGR